MKQVHTVVGMKNTLLLFFLLLWWRWHQLDFLYSHLRLSSKADIRFSAFCHRVTDLENRNCRCMNVYVFVCS